jgi:hypothetical protein
MPMTDLFHACTKRYLFYFCYISSVVLKSKTRWRNAITNRVFTRVCKIVGHCVHVAVYKSTYIHGKVSQKNFYKASSLKGDCTSEL